MMAEKLNVRVEAWYSRYFQTVEFAINNAVRKHPDDTIYLLGIAGDVKYGGPRVEGLHRPALHGYRLVLPNGVDVVAPVPADLTRLCRRLGLSLRGLRTEG